MELLTAIALLCQINFGFGSGDNTGYSDKLFFHVLSVVKREQISCQKKLATCILKNNDPTIITDALTCIKETK